MNTFTASNWIPVCTGMTKRRLGLSLALILIFLFLNSSYLYAQSVYVRHDLKVTLYPEEHRISVVDSITLPKDYPDEVLFYLHAGLKPTSPTPIVRINEQMGRQGDVVLEHFKVNLPKNLRAFVVTYEGKIDHPLESLGKEQARGFQNTPGTISAEGVYLSSDSAWYPDLGPGLVTFDLDVTMPDQWDAMSQGERTHFDQGGNKTFVHWKSPEPQDEIFLVAAKFTEYTKPTRRGLAMVYLRTPDETMASKYLEATAGYLEMYSTLIGPYPYKKFALVENFWETGFGMPSFTLLGPRVIRLPFIINTSYPHEILHNWWGNSVFPDYATGNWSEGLTAYLADHLMKEQQGMGAEYRVTTLQKYADYVLGTKDFPLTQFRSRHSSSTEAVGYGKALMFFHMLRLQLGDETFKLGLQEFYRNYKFHVASYDDLRKSFEAASGTDLRGLFEQWVTQTGAPQLKVSSPRVAQEGGQYMLDAVIEQTQPGDAYDLRVPVAVTMEGQEKTFQTIVEMKDKRMDLRLRLSVRPLRLDIDPEYDVFRRLNRAEIPHAISEALGAKRMLILLPSSAKKNLLHAYRELAGMISQAGPDDADVKLDTDIKELPADRTVTILGWENRFSKMMASILSGYDVTVGQRAVHVGRTDIAIQNHSFVFTSRLPKSNDLAAMFIASDTAEALPGLGQKLPHYHKYSYLAFEGYEPANVAKGRWHVANSPMTVFVPDEKNRTTRVDIGKLAPRAPLATRESIFSKEQMIDIIRTLASRELGGRGFGSTGLDKASEFIAREFKEAGLIPGGDAAGGWYQTWEDTGGDPPVPAIMRNVIGVIPGTKEGRKKESVVIGAHYDHLGIGWPESRDKKKGVIHPGADDNASGVAALIELARVLAKGPKPDRNIVFVAFTGEEAGKRGSKYYVSNEKRWPVNYCIGMVNLDTVGRLGKKKLLVLGAGSAREWVHILRGAGFVTGVDIDTVSEELDSSDQMSFQEAGVPAIQLFSGPNLDYHRTTDTPDKLDPEGLVKVASVAKEVVDYLARRDIPLSPSETSGAAVVSPGSTERKVGLGTVPDFAYSGRGFRLSGVVPRSPADEAGLKEGDVIIAINEMAVDGLKGFSDILKTLQPREKITITFLRENRQMSSDAVVMER